MKKITDFIINKRYFILVTFIIVTIICGFLATKVKINDDITAYLPSDSETRIGMDIMEREFSSQNNSSSLNIMFKNLDGDEIDSILNYLKGLEGVASVNYDNSDSYNKKEYTLFVLNVNEPSDSKIAKDIFDNIADNYQDYEFFTSGSIATSNTPILPSWILIVSVSCAVIILIIMCESYLEPFLFLVSILIAVILNSGTNIIFGEVSAITSSIAAILQMALSMDYSIMLMNRFREECEHENDKIKAMKNALYHSFGAISSSSLTTIVGLLTLIFMSFTIGKDLGLVLAKGVLLSLVSIFLCLPTLILVFDKLINKTRKKALNIKLNGLGKMSFKFKYPLTIIFVFFFIGSYFLKGNLGILYTSNEINKIDEVFGTNNQMAIIYNSKDEDKIADKLKQYNYNKYVNSMLSYSNTINEKLKYDELTKKMTDLGTSISIDNYLFKIMYYWYYNPSLNNKMTINDLVLFLEKEVFNNQDVLAFNNDMQKEIKKLKYFSDEKEINKKRDIKTLANILELDESNIEDILIYYNAKNNNVKLSIKEFLDFIKKDILSNPKYAGNFDKETLVNLEMLEKFTNQDLVNAEMDAKALGTLFGTDESIITQILFLKYQNVNSNDNYGLREFINKILDIKDNTNYLDNKDLKALEKLSLFSKNENNIVNTKLNKTQLSAIFDNINSGLVEKIYVLAGLPEDVMFSPNEFVDLILNKALNALDEASLNNLKILKLVMNDDGVKYRPLDLGKLLNLQENEINSLCALINLVEGNTSSWISTPKEFIALVLDNRNNEMLSNNLNSDTIKLFLMLQEVTSNPDFKYNSKSLSDLLGINKSKLDLIYGLYAMNNFQSSRVISLNNFISFMLDDVSKNNEYNNKIDNKVKNTLGTLRNIMDASLKNAHYNSNEMFKILNSLSSQLDKDKINLLYIYYGSVYSFNEEWTLTIEELVNFLNDDVKTEAMFQPFLNESLKNNIVESKENINDAKKMLVGDKYSRVVLLTNLEPESKETFAFIEDLKNNMGDDMQYYLIGDSPMALEMSKSFVKEFNYISILTMIAIFIVVAVTFKSILIPFVLVLLIQCAVYLTMGILSITGVKVYFIAILVVQSILMGATIDYAILYTSYYLEYREKLDIKNSLIEAYNSSIHTIMTSASILIIVTLILGLLASDITAVICKTIAEGTFCSTLLILLLLPGVLATFDKYIFKKKDFR